MRLKGYIAAIMVAGFAFPALAEVTVESVLVRQGYFQAPDCKPEADPKSFNECLCKADIHKAQLNGGSSDVMGSANAVLAAVPEQLASESCEGAAAAPPPDKIGVNEATANYEVAYQTPDVLTVLIVYSTYGAGAAHPLGGTEGFTIDLKTGKQIDPIKLMKPEDLAKVNSFVQQELLKKYADSVFDETKNRTEPFLTDSGCDTCTLYYTKDGWNVRFQLYAVAPYVTGEPVITVPADVIPDPQTLLAKR